MDEATRAVCSELVEIIILASTAPETFTLKQFAPNLIERLEGLNAGTFNVFMATDEKLSAFISMTIAARKTAPSSEGGTEVV